MSSIDAADPAIYNAPDQMEPARCWSLKSASSICHCLRQTRGVCARERERRSNPSGDSLAVWIASLALAMTIRDAIMRFCGEENVRHEKFGSSGPDVSVIGQGTWYIDQGNRKSAVAALH